MARRQKRKLSKKEIKAQKKTSSFVVTQTKSEKEETKEKEILEIPETIMVRDFASKLSVPVTELIKILMKNGVLATINESIDWETAAIAGDEFGREIRLKASTYGKVLVDKQKTEIDTDNKNLVTRPPVVTIMGHVDHGKTKLLDTIRQADVISTESGGITQHIGAYQITFKNKKITFIDTPGHEAFETMRAHGANITDTVVLIVAADEGIKPQTREAYEHAKKAGVPIIIAINKIDLPTANVQKVKQQLADMGLVPEDMGGKTICVKISAKQNLHIDDLLDMILLVSEMKDFKANPQKPASAVVVESHLDSKLGPVAHILIQDGTLREGDFFVVGEGFGKIRLIEDEYGHRLQDAGPSRPVKIAGIKNIPSFGEVLQAVPDERTAQIVLADMKKAKVIRGKEKGLNKKELHVVLKADVIGSLGAIKENLKKIESDEVKINITRDGAGDITEDDVMMAQATKARILGFKVKISPSAKHLAEKHRIRVSFYDIIYDLINDLKVSLDNLMKKEEEVLCAKARVIKIFKSNKDRKIIGMKVTEGTVEMGQKVKVKGENGKISSLKIGKEDVSKVESGTLVGLRIAVPIELAEGDVLEFYKIEKR